MNTITYKGKEYPTRTLTVIIDVLGEQDILVAPQSLADDMGDMDDWTDLETTLDETIYFYAEDYVMGKSGEELCDSYLDEPLGFVCDPEIEVAEEEPLYTIQDLDEDNTTDLQKWVDGGDLFALVDEKEGGIIGYINHAHAERIMNLLNSIPYLEANLRKLN